MLRPYLKPEQPDQLEGQAPASAQFCSTVGLLVPVFQVAWVRGHWRVHDSFLSLDGYGVWIRPQVALLTGEVKSVPTIPYRECI